MGDARRATRDRFVIIGGHLDSVPNGGWLDGTLNVVAGLEVLRALAPERRPLTLKLVDWADEEGARFGRSLLGSSACAGTLDPDAVRGLTDRDGTALPDALAAHGVELDRMRESGSRLEGALAYLELHIEQGPVLEQLDLPLGAVLGTFGVQRHRVALHRRARARRREPDAPAPRRVPRRRAQLAGLARRRRRARRRARHDRRSCACHARDRDRVQRHLRGVARPARARRGRARRHARRGAGRRPSGSPRRRAATVAWEQVWEIEPIPFDAGADRPRRRGDRGGRRDEPAAAERAAARRRGDGAASCRP